MARVSNAKSKPLDAALNAMIAAAPAGIGVNSEVRTRAQQQALYDAYRADPLHHAPAAKPGTSNHEKGLAADLAFSSPAAKEWAHANAARFGLSFPLANEPWHVELASARQPGTDAAVTASKPTTNAQIRAYAEQNYGYLASYLHDKEIGPILLRSAKEGWDSAKLNGALSKTNWWATHSQANRAWDDLNVSDHATAVAKVAEASATIRAAAQQAGVNLSDFQVHTLAVNYNRNGWNSDQLNTAMRTEAKVDPNKIAADYGPYTALAQSNPEIKNLLSQAQTNNWSQAQFTQAVQGTNWFRTTNPTTRANQLGQAADPSGQNVAHQQTHDKVITAGRNMGVPDSPALSALAEKAYTEGWDDTKIQRGLADLVKVDPTGKGNTGTTAVTVDSLKQQAASYMVPLSDGTLSQWVQQIQRGDVPPASFDSYLKEQAKSLFPAMGHALDAGLTVAQYVEPYKQYAAQTLEIDPATIDFLNNPKFSRALFNTDPKTGERTQMSLSDWQTYLRTLPEYNKTAQAQSQAADMAVMLTKTLGQVA